MLSKKHISFLLAFLFIQSNLLAQEKLNIKFGRVTPEDFNVKSSLIDSSINAVVVADVGKSQFLNIAANLLFFDIYRKEKNKNYQ